jgi:hypothetical protein
MSAHFVGDLFVNRAGMRLLVGDTELRQQLDDLVRFDLEFAR